MFTDWMSRKMNEAVDASGFPKFLAALTTATASSWRGVSPEDVDHAQKNKDKFHDVLEKVNQGLTAGQIANPDFNDLKSRINRYIDHAFESAISAKYFHAGKYQNIPEEMREIAYFHPQLHTIGSCLKKLGRMPQEHPVVKETTELLTELLPLSKAMDELKTKVYKGRKPPSEIATAVAKPVFAPPQAALNDVKRMSDLLRQITNDVAVKQVEAIKERLHRILNAFWDAYQNNKIELPYPNADPVRSWFKQDGYSIHVVERLTERLSNGMVTYRPNDPLAVKKDADQIMQKMAEQEAKEMQEAFVNKNTSKLAPIITAKASMADARVVRASADSGSITGEISVSFKDESRFVVRNQVVMSWSKYNKPFYRFPTTFHDVYLAGGEPMKQPSEEKMHKIFAGISPPAKSFEEWMAEK